ncbi:MAG: Fur family transcriptional regulator [Crocinitomicaceae bacterium]
MKANLLQKKNIRTTDFRLAVLEIFMNSDNAISTETIEDKLGDHDRITLYRTLKTFTEKGLIHEITIPGESKKMALCGASCSTSAHNHQHVHFKCNSCTEVYCLPLQNNHEVSVKGFKVEHYEVVASGICQTCL